MASSYTPLLGFVLPVTGELSGSWGTVWNDSGTSLLDSAISGTTSLTTDADVTLTTTTGAANEARQAIILWNPAAGTVTRNITAPAQSKIYTVINASGGTQSIVFRGAGPTTGVTIIKGESAVVAWNGTDFIKISNTGGGGSFTNVTISGTTTLSGLTASTALALNASKEVVSVTNTGTGNNVLATSPTLVTPALGTPTSVTLTNATGLPISTGVSGLGTGVATALAVNVGTAGSPVINGGVLGTPSSGTLTNATGLPISTGVSGLGAGVATFLATPSSANLAAAVTDETGSGALVFATSPTLVTPALGTPSSVTLTNATGLPVATGISGLGTGIATALAVNVGSAGAPVLFNGALGTPSSGTVTNLTGTASININGTVGATTANTGAFTTLTTSSTVTHNGGTANGVAYLNGSKVLTSGSALTFDGANSLSLGQGGTGTTTAQLVLNGSSATDYGSSIIGRKNGSGSWFIGDAGTALGGGALGTIFFNYGGTAPWRWHLQDNGEQMRLTSTGLGIGTSSPVSRLNVSGTTGFSWVGNGTSTALATIGTQGTGGSLFVNTASINSSFASGLAVDGTYSGPSSVVNLKAVGVNSGGGYNSSLAFHTSFETTLAEAMRLDSSGNLGIGTSSPGTKLQVLGTIAAQIGADGSNATGIRIYGSGSEKRVDFTGADGLANERISGIGTGGPGILTFSVNNNSAVMTERMRLDSSGNLGLGVTPSAWNSDYKAIQVGANGSIAGRVGASNSVDVTSNGFRNAAGNWQYIATNPVARFMVDGSIGGFQWFTAPSGTAGNAISFSQVMTLSASGDLGLGTTSPTNSTGYSTFSVNGSTGGQIVFQTGGVYKQSIFSAASDLNLYNSVAGNIIFATNATERARIDSSGNLLVGTTSAVGKVTIQDGALAFSGNASAPASNVGIYRGGSADNLIFATGGSERARIDSSGRLGVGTTTTSNARVTSVGVADNYPAFRAETSATTSQQQISFVNPNGVVGTIATDGSATSYNTSSDYRLKNITGPITTSGAYIDSLNPVEGTWKADGSTFVGLIAHEVQEASRTTVATGVKDGEEMQGMDYSSAEIIANMLAELKSLRARVAALESI